MAVTALTTHRVEKPWGRHDLAPLFADQPADRPAIGEIWYEDPSGKPRELLVKYLFTSERLSVQVHPDDTAARSRGFPRGKDEAWIILSAEADSTIALGLHEKMEAEAVRAGALDGSIESMLHWKPVVAGEVIYSPAGTIHAIGKGLRVVEVQQNLDLTYRFYDYGSDRELHLDEAMEVSDFGPFAGNPAPRDMAPGRTILAERQKFVLERWTMAGSFMIGTGSATVWVLPVEGSAAIDGRAVELGDALIVEGAASIDIAPGSTIYVAYPGVRVLEGLVGSESRSTSASG
ncbi:class I mannose-6-phosphate isomerase [Rhizorhabdus dicambivorans]|uniref:Phosphoheptose isomerase n=1 Tax=Rhizorhabdus dicambivorans TaxID=1850238 RepID=A0A2A4FY47_9SPHN|nr:class I mannose-6-phosphate isomerase [Rhizorhabdus dicambivorans]ATE66015.1 phosphoheptose isomerase [Rhizorhabdus dicambivorans]PCE43133.1 phosphoheptose isomerase [Rhizorhabdus dicambivorans]